MKTLSTLFLSICFAMTLAACGGSSTDAEAVDSQSDTTGDEAATYDDTSVPADDGAAMDDGAATDDGAAMDDGAGEGDDAAY